MFRVVIMLTPAPLLRSASSWRRARESRTMVCEEKLMEKDVVCGMQVDPAKAAATSEYNGKTYYFCAKACKARFDANPKQYVK
jgi:Cu+-exporting ATPase